MKPGGDRAPLFCVHSGVGFALPYLGLAKHLGAEYPLYGLQDPSVTELAPPPRSVVEMADDYIRRIKRVQPEGPYHVMGWSFGGIVAYEIAARLQVGHTQRLRIIAELAKGRVHVSELARRLDLGHRVSAQLHSGRDAVVLVRRVESRQLSLQLPVTRRRRGRLWHDQIMSYDDNCRQLTNACR
jgi:thioesterase domain-containing protein